MIVPSVRFHDGCYIKSLLIVTYVRNILFGQKSELFVIKVKKILLFKINIWYDYTEELCDFVS